MRSRRLSGVRLRSHETRKLLSNHVIASPEHVEETVRRDIRRLGRVVSGSADSTARFHLLLPFCRDTST